LNTSEKWENEEGKKIPTILSENEFVYNENKAINIFYVAASRGWVAIE